MLRATPPDRDPLNGARGLPVPFFNSAGTPPGEDGIERGTTGDQLENMAQYQASEPDGVDKTVTEEAIDFLALVRQAEDQASLYVAQVNRKAWSQSLRAFHNEHYIGSKYTKPDWRGRSKLFVPKTRGAVRKDQAAVTASLFNNIDAITCMPGNESDPKQRASAAVMQELVNYRTDRSSGKASFPWFLLSVGSRQDALLTGICVSKQCWKQDFRKVAEEKVHVQNPETGVYEETARDVYKLEVDRPDMMLIPPENVVIDPSANWLNPAQSAAYLIVKWPMQIEEIKDRQNAPINPWNDISEEVLKNSTESGKWDMAAIRRARELGLDRLDETQTGTHFQVIWVYEVFMRVGGEDYTFYSVGDQQYLTDPRPTREVYPEQHGERPIAMGYGSLEAHRIYPMSPVESWQPLQLETNDLRNLILDATKQNVMPISKVRRGRQIDLDQVKRRSSGSSIIVSEPDDVTWETPPQVPQTAIAMSRELNIEMDDLAGTQNFGALQNHDAVGDTLGGLKLAAGAANAVQEFDIRVWIETWASPALAQIVRLEQFYEADPVVLGLVGQKAQLLEKYGIDQITDELLEQDVTVRVSVGLGAGDPMQRLAKFSEATKIAVPLLSASPKFQSGEIEIDEEAILDEVYGAVGYKDGGKRFFKRNQGPKPNPAMDLQTELLKARIAKEDRTGKAAMFQGISSLAKVALGKRQLEADVVDRLLGHQGEAHRMGFEHGAKQNDQHLAAMDHGHRHGLALAQHRHQVGQDQRAAALEEAQAQAEQAAGGGAEMEGAPPAPSGAPSGAGPTGSPSASPPPNDALMQLLQSGQLQFTRDPKTGRIAGIAMAGQGGPNAGPGGPGQPFPLPPGAGPQGGPAQPPGGAPVPSAPGQQFARDLQPERLEAMMARIDELESKLAQAASKPKRIIRDPKTNHIVGIE